MARKSQVERIIEIQRRFSPGAAATDVAAALGVSYTTAYVDFRAMGWPRNDPHKHRGDSRRNPERKAAILAVIRAEPERTLFSIGDQFGITRERVRQIAAEDGERKPQAYAKGPRGHSPKYLAERERIAAKLEARRKMRFQILALHRRGWGNKAIAGLLGCSSNVVSQATLRGGQRAKGPARKVTK